jgi:cytochrome b6-f complex iron-sulfur subunit
MDHFGVEIDGGNNFIVNTGNLSQGPPIGTNTTGQEAEGPHCIGQAGGH